MSTASQLLELLLNNSHQLNRDISGKADDVIHEDVREPISHRGASSIEPRHRMPARVPGKPDAEFRRRIGEGRCDRHHDDRLIRAYLTVRGYYDWRTKLSMPIPILDPREDDTPVSNRRSSRRQGFLFLSGRKGHVVLLKPRLRGAVRFGELLQFRIRHFSRRRLHLLGGLRTGASGA
jgi:hypothetical protein